MNTFTKAIFLVFAASASGNNSVSFEYDDLLELDSFIGLENNNCVGNASPNGITRKGSDNGNGSRFKFNLSGTNKLCTDQNRGRTYSHGTFKDVRSFESCATKCVEEGPIDLINNGSFRGIDFDCYLYECRCLFDQGELNTRNTYVFDRTSRSQQGYGSIDRNGGRSEDGFYCGTLVGFMEAEEFLQAEVVETGRLRGGSAK